MSDRNLWPEPWYDTRMERECQCGHTYNVTYDPESERLCCPACAPQRFKVDGPSEVRQSFVKVAVKVADSARALLVNWSDENLERLEMSLKDYDREMGRVT